MSDKDFKVKNKLVVNGLTGGAGPLVANSNKEIDSVAYLTTLQGGTGTTTSPSAGQVLYSAGGTTYNPTTLNTLDVKGATYSADAPSSPVIGQIWVESDTSSDSFDPNIIRRKTFTATANQTVFTTDLEFIQGYEQVFFNGMLLIRNSDYTTASNTNVTLAAGAAAGDIIEVVSITNLNSINAATTTTNTFTGNQIVNARIGISTSSPDAKLTVQESGDAQLTLKNSSGVTKSYIGTNGAIGSASTDDLRIRSDASNIIFGFSGFEKMRFNSSGTAIFGPVATGTPPSTSKVYVNNSSNENIGNPTWGGSLVINEYSNTLNGNMGIEFKTRADSNGSGWRISSLANNPDLVFESRQSSATWSEKMRIDGNGTGYITSPNWTLAPVSGSANPTLKIRNSNYSDGSPNQLILGVDGSTFYGVAYLDTSNAGVAAATPLSFRVSGTERARINANGNFGVGWAPDNNWHLSVNNAGSGVGAFLSTTSGASVFSGLFEASNSSYVGVITRAQTFRSNTSAFRFFDAFSSSTGVADLEFNLRGDGQAYADGSWNAGGADYAEYFEWADGNPNNEDRRGYSVSLIGKKIKIAEQGENPIGIISGNPSIIGDAGWNMWNKKYLVDDFGSYIRDENGERILNTEFDPDAEYVSREDRPEWAVVGLMGKLRLRKGQQTGAGWIKMDDISDTVEEWLVK